MSYQQEIDNARTALQKAQDDLGSIEEKQRGLMNNEPRAVAEYLHEKGCTANHTDWCGWFYETWDSPNANTRLRWLKKAERLIEYAATHNIPLSVALEIRVME